MSSNAPDTSPSTVSGDHRDLPRQIHPSSRMHTPTLSNGEAGALSQDRSTTSSSPTMPTRLPRARTPAELHLELEQEQEAIVNRLQRDLSALRAHSASISSNISSTSAVVDTPSEIPLHAGQPGAQRSTSQSNLSHQANQPHPTNTRRDSASASPVMAGMAPPYTIRSEIFPLISGPTHPIPSRRHRSSSSVSGRSATSSVSASVPVSTPGLVGASQASMDRARDAGRDSHTHATGQSQGQAPLLATQGTIPATSISGGGMGEYIRSRGNSFAVQSAVPSPSPREASFHASSGHARSVEMENARAELAHAKAENDALVERVRELEKMLREEVTRFRAESNTAAAD